MNLDDWYKWPEELHSDPEQIKRQASARKADLTPKEIKEDYAVFKGSKSDYCTSLKACDCGDFRKRKLPCKHMYRLAFEEGLFDLGAVDVDKNINKEIRIDDAMKIANALPEDKQIAFRDMLYDCYYGDGQTLIPQEDFDLYHNAHLVKDQPDKRAILGSFKRSDLIPLIPEGVNCKKNKISTIVDCIIDNTDLDYTHICDPMRMVVLDESVSRVALAMYKRLLQRYPVERDDWWS